MHQVYRIKNAILTMFNQCHNPEIRKALKSFLYSVMDIAEGERGGLVSETLLNALDRCDQPRCSEKQALAVAYCAYEHCLDAPGRH